MATIYGKASDPQMQLSSEPPLQYSDIVSLLATGVTTAVRRCPAPDRCVGSARRRFCEIGDVGRYGVVVDSVNVIALL